MNPNMPTVTLWGVLAFAKALVVGMTAAILAASGSTFVRAEDSAAVGRIDSYLIEADIETDGSLTVIESVTFAPGSFLPDDFVTRMANWIVPDQPDRIKSRDVQLETLDSDPPTITATYSITGAFREFTEAELEGDNPLGLTAGDAEIFAEVIGPLPDLSIAQARVQVRTPGPALAAACFVDGRSIPVCTDRIGDVETTFRSLDLAPGASMSIALVIDGSTVTIPDANDAPSNSHGFPWLLVLSLAAAVVLAAFVAVAWSVRRKS